MSSLKINGCSICTYNKCNIALIFHHVNPEDKEFCVNLYNIRRYAGKTFAEEANKCMLLCANCHAEVETIGKVL